jgi:hypothetical protein
MKYKTVILPLLLLCIAVAAACAQGKGGNAPCDLIRTKSDTTFLSSFIGEFNGGDIIRLDDFLNSKYVKEKRYPKEKFGRSNVELMDSLKKVVPIKLCRAATYGSGKDYKTELDRKIIKPLLKLVRENHGVCQMCFDAMPF